MSNTHISSVFIVTLSPWIRVFVSGCNADIAIEQNLIVPIKSLEKEQYPNSHKMLQEQSGRKSMVKLKSQGYIERPFSLLHPSIQSHVYTTQKVQVVDYNPEYYADLSVALIHTAECSYLPFSVYAFMQNKRNSN